MDHAEHLSRIVLLLAAAVCIVALFRRLHLSPVLGYLASGIAIGPHGLALIEEVESTRSIAEFGVVFLLFVIGLELSFERLKRMRGRKLWFGVGQVAATSTLIAGAAHYLGLSAGAAIIIGGGLALSSTAIVLELMSESSEKITQTGRLALATLIIQDLAVIPLLVLVPLLAVEGSLMQALGEASAKALLGLVVIVVLGRMLLRPLFRYIATHSHHELFTATTLLVVFGLAYISALAGVSPALGAFMGGLLIAETEFRPQVEADILPFKGLLLGLFFITVGMSVDLHYVLAHAGEVFLLLAGLLAVKALVMLAVAAALRFPPDTAIHSSLLLAQGGEFAFVLFGLAAERAIITPELQQLLVSSIVLSMVATPLLHVLGKHIGKRVASRNPAARPPLLRETLELRDHVIIMGFGRVGRVVAQLLEAERIPYAVLDMDATVVGDMREQNKLVYYGDGGRAIVLKAVGLMRAQAVILTHADMRASLQTIGAVRQLHRSLPIIARAKNIRQVLELEQAGANLAVAEMFETSLQLGGALLKEVGVTASEVARILDAFRAGDYALARQGGEEPTPA